MAFEPVKFLGYRQAIAFLRGKGYSYYRYIPHESLRGDDGTMIYQGEPGEYAKIMRSQWDGKWEVSAGALDFLSKMT